MNATRRDELEKINEQIDEIRGRLEDILSDEQEYYSNMPESLQGSERGQASEGAISDIECAISDLHDVDDYLRGVFQN